MNFTIVLAMLGIGISFFSLYICLVVMVACAKLKRNQQWMLEHQRAQWQKLIQEEGRLNEALDYARVREDLRRNMSISPVRTRPKPD